MPRLTAADILKVTIAIAKQVWVVCTHSTGVCLQYAMSSSGSLQYAMAMAPLPSIGVLCVAHLLCAALLFVAVGLSGGKS